TPDPAGATGHADRQVRRTDALQLPDERRRGDSRILPTAAARQGRAGRLRMVDRGLEQPRSAEPVAEPGSQPDHSRPHVQPPAARTPRSPAAERLPADSTGANHAWLVVART